MDCSTPPLRGFAGRRGISQVVVVILVIATFGLVTAALVLYFRFADLQRVQKEMSEALLTETGARDERAKEIPKATLGSGLAGEGTNVDPKDLSNKKPKDAYDARIVALLGGGDNGDAAVKAAKESRLYPTLQSLVELASRGMQAQYNRQKSLRLELLIAKERADKREAALRDRTFSKSKEDYIKELDAMITKITTQITDENNSYNTRKTELTTLREDANRQIEEETTAYNTWEIKIKNETRELQRQLDELKVKEVIKVDISQSHGRILRPDVTNKLAFIDIGSRERVVAGLKFLVARRGNQGRFEFKAAVIVKKVWMTYAEVAITTVYATDIPVIEGDFIVNPLFNKHRAVVVAFAGEEKPLRLRPAWSIDEASRRITEIGSVVRKEPDLEVDFVIWTEAGMASGAIKQQNQYDAFKKATLLEIPIAEASEMFRFLGE